MKKERQRTGEREANVEQKKGGSRTREHTEMRKPDLQTPKAPGRRGENRAKSRWQRRITHTNKEGKHTHAENAAGEGEKSKRKQREGDLRLKLVRLEE